MSSLPPALNFPETEEEIVKKWKEEESFRLQNELSLERGDEVSLPRTDRSYQATLIFSKLSSVT